MYAGTYVGVFKSTNGGANWSYRTSPEFITALAIDPQTPATIYAGLSSGGVYRSLNGGTNWMIASAGLGSIGSLERRIRSLAIDPQTPSTLYAATQAGVFKSTNGATNWSEARTGLNSWNVWSLAIDPQTNTTLYAGTAGGAALFRSTDGGASWSAFNTGLNTTGSDIAWSLAIDPHQPGKIYAGTGGKGVFEYSPVVAGASCLPLVDGMVAWWRAEGNTLDSVGMNHGTLAGASFAAGWAGQAFTFDGGNDGVLVGDTVALRPLTNLTIEGWIKTSGVSPSAMASFIAARSGLANEGYEFGVYPLPTGELRFTLNGGAGGADLFSTNGVADNAFHHVAATYDGVKLRIYRDGLLDGEKAAAVSINYTPGNPLWIGRRELTAIPGYFAGLIDELSIYERALTEIEIAAIHAAGNAAKCPVTIPPTLHIAALSAAVRLSWTTNATSYLLETNHNLSHPAGWGVLTSNYSVLYTNFVVTNTIGPATRFFRLRKL